MLLLNMLQFSKSMPRCILLNYLEVQQRREQGKLSIAINSFCRYHRPFSSSEASTSIKKFKRSKKKKTKATKRSNISGGNYDMTSGSKIQREFCRRQGLNKTEFNRLKNAARIIPYWLMNESECLDWILNELKIKRQMEDSDEYSTMYLESVSSFSQDMLNQLQRLLLPNSNVEVKGEEEALFLHSLFYRLANAGLDDLQCAKKFRQMKVHNDNLHEFHKRINRKKRQLMERKIKRLQAQQMLDSYLTSKPRCERNESGSDIVADTHGKVDEFKLSVSWKVTLLQVLVTSAMKYVPSFLKRPLSVQMDDVLVKGHKDHNECFKSDSKDNNLLRLKRDVELSHNMVKSTDVQIQKLELKAKELEASFNQAEYQRLSAVVKSVIHELCPRLANHMAFRHKRLVEQYQTLDSKTDLTKPHEWYLYSRLDRRRVIFHGGPTNSGKTFQALERLKEAKRGLYVGPLRLLAAEVYEMLNAQGIYTNLLTGQEKQVMPFATCIAATIELAPTDEQFDIVVIDEIQMIGDSSRGYAWTRALLGVRCKEIHVCGGMEARHLTERIVKLCGDDFELREYERLTKLSVANASLSSTIVSHGCYKDVEPGDCVVAFSRADIFAIKREIEKSTIYKCCVVYGSLPPETRAEQARLFNNPSSGYDVLVASDAIGMGLNLSIRRIIFNSVFKSNGQEIIKLSHSSMKQIAGRAGRRNSPFPDGEVTVRDPRDLDYLRWCLTTDISPISKAGLLPTSSHIKLFSEAIQEYDMSIDANNISEILKKFAAMATLQGNFFLCRQKSMEIIARQLTDLPLQINDKYTLCMAPISTSNQESISTLRSFAVKHSLGRLSGLNRKHIPKPALSFDDLGKLCSIHSELELFLWLLHRFPGNFVEEQNALTLQERCIELINRGLAASDKLKLDHCYVSRDDRLRKIVQNREKSHFSMENDITDLLKS